MKKSYNYIFASAFMLIAQAKIASAQNEYNCGTSEARQALHAAHPELVQKEIDYEKELALQIQNKKQQKSAQSAEVIYTIPIVFHVIHTFGSENISDAQIFDQVNILNRDYAKLNADTSQIVGNSPFDSLACNIKIQFRLAHLDPNGNCTNGIDRIYSHRTNQADDNSKLNQWPRDRYLNVWTVKTIGSAGVAGYAFYPSDVDGFNAPNDGVLILSQYIGSIGTSTPNTSRALTHEIGHWMSLQHPWGNTNSPEVACGDDAVQDTPLTRGHLSCDLWTPWCETHPFATPYTFSGISPVSGTTDTTSLHASSGVTFGSFSAVGMSANSVDSSRFSFAKLDSGSVNGDSLYSAMTGSINTSKYYQVTITPAWGSTISLTGLSFNFQRSATGVRSYAVRSSVNGYASNLAASITPSNTSLNIAGTNEFFLKYDTTSSQSGSKITLGGASYTNVITPITLRFYGWNAEDSLGTFSIDNVSISGSSGVIENTQNYMDYSYCSVMFTKGQKERMRTALESSTSGRNHLWRTENLGITGTDVAGQTAGPCIPHPDFYANRNEICANNSVTFIKNILQGTATSSVWAFEGGTPATSSAASPVVTYSTPGDYAVKLSASNATGTDSVIKSYYIHVSPPWAEYNGIASENFESTPSAYANWLIDNYDNNQPHGWSLTNTAGYSGTHSMGMGGFNDYPFDVDDFITPIFDMSYVSAATMTFRCAAASAALATANVNDALRVYSTNNCGQTWQLRLTLQGAALNNANYHPEYFVPTSQSQWALQTVNMPGNLATNNVRFKFEYTSGNASNNIYIDDININGVLGIKESVIEDANVSIYPNPSEQTTTLAYHLNAKATTKIELFDLLGKKVMELNNGVQTDGDYTVPISKQQYNINSGIYFIKLSIDNVTTTKKLIFTE
jgi:PKD repeat protein